MKAWFRLAVAVGFTLSLVGCEGQALMRKSDWGSLVDQSKVENAKKCVFTGDYDKLFNKLADMLQEEGGVSLEKRSKADGIIETGPYGMGNATQAVMNKEDNGTVSVKWTMLFVYQGTKRPLFDDAEKRATYNDQMNYKFLEYLQTGKLSK